MERWVWVGGGNSFRRAEQREYTANMGGGEHLLSELTGIFFIHLFGGFATAQTPTHVRLELRFPQKGTPFVLLWTIFGSLSESQAKRGD